jgi:hypothetical protein
MISPQRSHLVACTGDLCCSGIATHHSGANTWRNKVECWKSEALFGFSGLGVGRLSDYQGASRGKWEWELGDKRGCLAKDVFFYLPCGFQSLETRHDCVCGVSQWGYPRSAVSRLCERGI